MVDVYYSATRADLSEPASAMATHTPYYSGDRRKDALKVMQQKADELATEKAWNIHILTTVERKNGSGTVTKQKFIQVSPDSELQEFGQPVTMPLSREERANLDSLF